LSLFRDRQTPPPVITSTQIYWFSQKERAISIFDDVICPVSFVQIDSNVSRLTVFLNAALIALYLATGLPYFMMLVALDYGIRAIWNPKYSPLRWVAAGLVRVVGLSEKLIDQAPKLFASRVGFLFAAISVLLLSWSMTASLVVGGVLLIFTILDSVFDFCVGCLTYYYVVLPFYQWRGIR